MSSAAKSHSLTRLEARRIWLHAQRLDASAPFGAGPAATTAAVEHLGYVQIDTINVIERSHHHVLWTRIPDYRRGDLRQAQSADKSVFEYWTHALSYVPTRDIRFFIPAMKQHQREGHRWFSSVTPADLRKVMRLIRRDGALTIRDIDDDVLTEKEHLWASRKPSKRALQLAFYSGALAISERNGMLKTYELMTRHFGWDKVPKAASVRETTAYLLDRAQRAVEQIGGGFPYARGLRHLVPAEMPRHQFIGLQHAVALADGQRAGIKRQLQRPLRRLAAGPQMLLFGQDIVVDVADGQRAVAPDQPHHLAQIGRRHRGEPPMALALMLLHRRDEEADIAGRHIGQRVGPVFEHALVGALGLAQIASPVVGDAGPQHVVMRALDDVDGVDLHIAEMLDRGGGGRGPGAERRRSVEPLGVQPDAPGLEPGQGMGFGGGRHACSTVAGFVPLKTCRNGRRKQQVEMSGHEKAAPPEGSAAKPNVPLDVTSSCRPSAPSRNACTRRAYCPCSCPHWPRPCACPWRPCRGRPASYSSSWWSWPCCRTCTSSSPRTQATEREPRTSQQ